jgi:hypothetical protein
MRDLPLPYEAMIATISFVFHDGYEGAIVLL